MHCLLQTFTVTQEEEGDNATHSIIANLLGLDEERGGISVQVNGSVRLYGEIERFYQLSQDIEVHKFTRLSFMYTDLESADGASLCLYEELNLNVQNSCPSRCFVPEEGHNVIDLGNIFSDRLTAVRIIGFRQGGGVSECANLHMFTTAKTGTTNDKDLCVDPNARRLVSIGCKCMDGYALSNGGNVQGEFDTCLSCLSTPDCHFNASTSLGEDECARVSKNSRLIEIEPCMTE